ncbi:predicted protein [Botrytis cinerea T4]|uniref:Uncharacterized protein n=1 Tax=Botryotinia fuckeliana (strain T4) TaxID=999810 RepID=G2Y6N8_BOTF4|nr:predicted protein [Botrytis cinerea T4]
MAKIGFKSSIDNDDRNTRFTLGDFHDCSAFWGEGEKKTDLWVYKWIVFERMKSKCIYG